MKIKFVVSQHILKETLEKLGNQGAKLINLTEDDGNWFISFGKNSEQYVYSGSSDKPCSYPKEEIKKEIMADLVEEY